MPKPPQMEDLFDKFKEIKSSGLLVILVLIIVGLGAYTSLYTIKQAELGVVQRFGEYVRTEPPGLNYKLPFGIETVRKVNVEKVNTEEFGLKTGRVAGGYRNTTSSLSTDAALMLTGDLNVAVVPWIVQYRISGPKDYLFKVQDVKAILRDMSEASMRTVVGDRSINEVISKRTEIADAAKVRLQKEMNEAGSGLTIVTIEMKETNVPQRVQPSFNEVNQARQEKEQTIYKAREGYNKAVPLARGEAQRIIKDAEGYAIDRVNRAQGDATKFVAIYEEYRQAKDITKKRLYLEAMLEIFPKLGPKYIIDSEQKNLLPFLNMGDGRNTPNALFNKGE